MQQIILPSLKSNQFHRKQYVDTLYLVRRYVTLDYKTRNKLYYNLLISLKCLKILISENDRMLFYSGQVYKSILQVYCYARLHYFVNFPT